MLTRVNTGRWPSLGISQGPSGGGVLQPQGGVAPPLSLFFNSSEPGGDGSDPNVLFADDFSRTPPFLYNSVNNVSVANAGWNGGSFGSADPAGTNFGRTSGGVGGGHCASNGGHYGPPAEIGQGRGMADHSLSESVTDVYIRYYVWFSSDYQFGQEKGLTINKGPAGIAGIYAGSLFYGLNATGEDPAPEPTFLTAPSSVTGAFNKGGNQGNNYHLIVGHWNFIQVRIKFQSPGTDIMQYWADDCGPNGTTHPASPTLRASYNNLDLRPAGDASPSIGSVWFENWANPPALGEIKWAKIMVKKTGPIGFAA